jgi:hypothetical protein
VDIHDAAVKAGDGDVSLQVTGGPVSRSSGHQRLPQIVVGDRIQLPQPAPSGGAIDAEPPWVYELNAFVPRQRVEEVREVGEGLEIAAEQLVEAIAQQLVLRSLRAKLES